MAKLSCTQKVPVVWKGKPLMPTTQGRAFYMVKMGRAIFVKDKHLGTFLKLKQAPSGLHKSKLILGIDPGTCWTGYSVVGENVEQNYEFENTRKIKNRNFIKQKMEEKRASRRQKRSRLRHREARFSNRTGKKMFATTNYYIQNITNMVKWLKELYPITKVAIEDIAYNHYTTDKKEQKRGASFSPLEVGKKELYRKLGKVRKVKGWQTARFRANQNLFKTKDKSRKDFSAHCVDSYAIARIASGLGTVSNNKVTFISRGLPNIDANRRTLRRFIARVREFKNYFRWHNGEKVYFEKLSKLRKIRVKITDDQGNHGPWNYLYTKQVPCFKHYVTGYGSSICNTNQKGQTKGENKYGKNFDYYKVA